MSSPMRHNTNASEPGAYILTYASLPSLICLVTDVWDMALLKHSGNEEELIGSLKT